MIAFDDFVALMKSGRVIRQLRRFDESRILVHRLESAGRPLPLALVLRWVTRGDVRIADGTGRSRVVDATTLSRWIEQIAFEPFRKQALLRQVETAIRELECSPRTSRAPLDLSRSPLYLRSDLSFGVRAGGSVGHIAGVLNELGRFSGPPIFVTTDDVSTVDESIEQHVVSPPEAFWNFKELPTMVLNDAIEHEVRRALNGRTLSFVYQRYSLNNYTGVRVARDAGVPLVVEYNGSEVWMSRHWRGRRLVYEKLSDRIERLNLHAAELVVVVSANMKKEVVDRGVDAARVLVNPNGVDTRRYSPEVDGTPVRVKYRLGDAVVIGFIGTFGPWHGAEMLARAFARMRVSHPDLASRARLLMIGDGATLVETRRILSANGALDAAAFTGLVPQEDGAKYLAACDVLVSPHVPNPDGTPFFGSPTKLFEYMAMSKGIVASNLDQIGEVLEHGRTALLVPPNDVDALAEAIGRLARDGSLRECLGAEARRVVLDKYTWREHTRRTIGALRNCW